MYPKVKDEKDSLTPKLVVRHVDCRCAQLTMVKDVTVPCGANLDKDVGPVEIVDLNKESPRK